MSDPMDPEFTAQNPIVAAATRIRAKRELARAVDDAAEAAPRRRAEDAEESLRLFAESAAAGCTRVNAILGEREGVRFIRLERPLRVRLRFRERRVSADLDDVHQSVRLSGLGLDGEYVFDPASDVPALINLSKISTDPGYGERLTASSLLKALTSGAELPRPAHLNELGPLTF